MLNICVPVLRRYDLLRELVLSIQAGTVLPNKYYIINNGRNEKELDKAIGNIYMHSHIHIPDKPMGVAESWNWFIQNVPEERVIVNDDVVFDRTSLGRLASVEGDLVWADGCGFSCYIIRDSCVQKIGLFDETISPGYGYYEDEDYLQRLDGRGTREPSAIARVADCGIRHLKSETLKAATHEEILEHHRRFKIAQANYMRKWSLASL